MGMGLLAAGALSGLGQAGSNIGQQMVKSALDEQERDYIMRRQQEFQIAQEERTDARVEQKRKDMMADIATERDSIVGNKTSPLYDEATQKIGMLSHLTDEEKTAALDAVSQNKTAEQGKLRGDLRTTIEAGINTGHISPEKAAGLLKSDAGNEVKLAIAEGRINQLQDYLTFKRDKLEADDSTKRRGQDMRAETAASGQASKSEQADKNRSAYGQTGNKEWQSTIKAYDNEFESKNAMGEKEFDAVGKSAFARMLEINRERGAKPGEAASGALAAIRALRKQASSPDGTIDHDKYEALVGAMFKRMK